MIKRKGFINIIIIYLALCFTGAALEYCYGAFWNVVGNTPWIYPLSFLHYTSLEGIPLWGFGGFIAIAVYRTIRKRRAKELLKAIIPLLLAVLWIVIYANFIAPI